MSLTSIRWPENANERTSDTTSCRLWISSRKKSETRATEPETSQSATIFGLSRCLRFQTVRKGMPPQAAFLRMFCGHRDGRGAGACAAWRNARAGAGRSGGSARASSRFAAARSAPAARCAKFRCAGFLLPRGHRAGAPARRGRERFRAAHRSQRCSRSASAGLVAVSSSRSSLRRWMPICSSMRL